MTLCCRSAGHQGHSADQWNAPGAGSVLSGRSNRPQATRRRLAFVPINPGVGMYHDRIKLRFAEGSVYGIEPWGPGGVLGTLQIQIRRLYDALAERVEGKRRRS